MKKERREKMGLQWLLPPGYRTVKQNTPLKNYQSNKSGYCEKEMLFNSLGLVRETHRSLLAFQSNDVMRGKEEREVRKSYQIQNSRERKGNECVSGS